MTREKNISVEIESLLSKKKLSQADNDRLLLLFQEGAALQSARDARMMLDTGAKCRRYRCNISASCSDCSYQPNCCEGAIVCSNLPPCGSCPAKPRCRAGRLFVRFAEGKVDKHFQPTS